MDAVTRRSLLVELGTLLIGLRRLGASAQVERAIVIVRILLREQKP